MTHTEPGRIFQITSLSVTYGIGAGEIDGDEETPLSWEGRG